MSLQIFREIEKRMQALKIDDIKEPKEEKEENEVALAIMNNTIKRLYWLHKEAQDGYLQMMMSITRRALQRDDPDNPQLRQLRDSQRILMHYSTLLHSVLRAEVELLFPEAMGQRIFYRKGWIITRLHPDDEDLDINYIPGFEEDDPIN